MNRRAFILGAAMVLLTNLVAVALKTYAEAAFIAGYGKSALPWLLIASAGGFAGVTIAYDQLARRAPGGRADLVLLGALLVAIALSPALLDAGAPPVIIVIATAAAPQVAGLALWNRVAASVAGRDARRMLPRAGAAVTGGGVIAGLGVGALIASLGATIVPYIGAGVLVVVIALYVAQGRALARGGAPGAGLAPPPASPRQSGKGGGQGTEVLETYPRGAAAPVAAAAAPKSAGLSAIARRLLVALVIAAIFEGVLSTVIDLQFLGTLKARYTGNSLAVALSLFYGGTNAILLLLQVAAVPRVLVTRSVPTTVAIHPALVILGYAIFAIAPGFAQLAGTRTADQVLRLATSRTSQEIELSALPPEPRARWKVLLRGALYPVGAAAAALALLLVGPVLLQNPVALAGAGIGVAIVWWVLGQIAARRFQAALAAPLGIKGTRRADTARIDLETLERWIAVAGDADVRAAGLARAALVRARVDATDLNDHLTHDDPAMRAALFDQVARAPAAIAAGLRAELGAAIAIEDDDRALARGVKALALLGDDRGLVVAEARAVAGAEVGAAARTAALALRGTGDARVELVALCGRDPEWAIALIRKAALTATEGALADALADAGARPGALAVIAHTGAGGGASFAAFATALAEGDAPAIAAVAGLDREGAEHLVAQLAHVSPVARAIAARALAGAPGAEPLVGALLVDPDPEVAYAALRTALALASGGATLPAQPIATALEAARAALVAHLDARDAAGTWSACARAELELALRRCVARLLWASAVEAAATGRDPAPLAATARHLIGDKDADRKRALDVVQELQAGRPEILAILERWLRPPTDTPGGSVDLAPFDPWLAQLAAGELSDLEPTLALLRKPALLATVAGPALADLAARARREQLAGIAFHQGDAGDTMLVVARGELIARRTGAPDRRIGVGGVVGELAVLTHAPRAATVLAADPDAPTEVLAIDRATFAAATRRAPELVLGLSATLAGWIAPNRPDLL